MLKPKKVARTFSIGERANDERKRDALNARVFTSAHTAVGVAVQALLSRLQVYLAVEEDDNGKLQRADLWLPISPRQEESARQLVAQARPTAPPDKGAKEAARPQYRNSYHMEEVAIRDGRLMVRCRVAERFVWQVGRGPFAGQWQHDIMLLDATRGLQGLLKSWVPIPWGDVPSALRAGACQQAAQQFNSYLALRAQTGRNSPTVSFPSLAERDPAQRKDSWEKTLGRVVTGTHPFVYARAREMAPEKYQEDDPRGDRKVNIDPDWVEFVASPFPRRQTLNFVKSDDIVVYRCRRDNRLYAALPLFTGVDDASPLGRLRQEQTLFWWQQYVETFEPLPAWTGQKLSRRRPLFLVQLESRNPDWMTQALSGRHGRAVSWSLVTEQAGTRGRRNRRQWKLDIVTFRHIDLVLRPHVLGIHFGVEPILWWCLMDGQRQVLACGSVPHNVILSEGLAQQLRLQEEQGKQRWVGDRRSRKELKRRTDEIARSIVELAAEHDANLALEQIEWVDKRFGSPEANRRHSMWNFSQLLDRITAKGLERCVGEQPEPVVTVCTVKDYILRYTCPGCGACRKAKEPVDQATTWREGNELRCRQCGYHGVVPDDHQAKLVGQLGVDALQRRQRAIEDH